MSRLASSLLVFVIAWPAAAAEPMHWLRIAAQRPTCTAPDGLPITPNDPASVYAPGGRRCYGTRPAELELRLPEDRYVWLDQSAPNPAVWIDLGMVIVDPRALSAPPLGLRLDAADGALSLETRWGDASTLTRLEPGRWREIHSPDGQRFWVQLAPDTDPSPAD
jgi:hypothetical protein